MYLIFFVQKIQTGSDFLSFSENQTIQKHNPLLAGALLGAFKTCECWLIDRGLSVPVLSHMIICRYGVGYQISYGFHNVISKKTQNNPVQKNVGQSYHRVQSDVLCNVEQAGVHEMHAVLLQKFYSQLSMTFFLPYSTFPPSSRHNSAVRSNDHLHSCQSKELEGNISSVISNLQDLPVLPKSFVLCWLISHDKCLAEDLTICKSKCMAQFPPRNRS